VRRGDRAEERQPLVEDHVEPAPQHDPNTRQRRARVGRADGDRARAARRSRNRAECRARTAVVAGGSDDDGVQVERSLDRARLRAVGERGVGLSDADHGNPHRIVRVAVAVRVNSALEAGDQLVAAAVDEILAVGPGLPAGDPDRQHLGTGCDAAQSARSARADEDARQLSAMPLELGRILRIRPGARIAVAADEIDAGQDLPA
jgi:hypothetical protein